MLMKYHPWCNLWCIRAARFITLDAAKCYFLLGVPLKESKALLRTSVIWCSTLVKLKNFRVEDALFVGIELESMLGRDC